MRLLILLFILSFSATSALASTVSYRFTAERGVGPITMEFQASSMSLMRPSGEPSPSILRSWKNSIPGTYMRLPRFRSTAST